MEHNFVKGELVRTIEPEHAEKMFKVIGHDKDNNAMLVQVFRCNEIFLEPVLKISTIIDKIPGSQTELKPPEGMLFKSSLPTY
jgi:hypothetical protein